MKLRIRLIKYGKLSGQVESLLHGVENPNICRIEETAGRMSTPRNSALQLNICLTITSGDGKIVIEKKCYR